MLLLMVTKVSKKNRIFDFDDGSVVVVVVVAAAVVFVSFPSRHNQE